MLKSSIWPIDGSLLGIIAPDKCELGGDDSSGVLCIP